jgi:hypothetical protein
MLRRQLPNQAALDQYLVSVVDAAATIKLIEAQLNRAFTIEKFENLMKPARPRPPHRSRHLCRQWRFDSPGGRGPIGLVTAPRAAGQHAVAGGGSGPPGSESCHLPEIAAGRAASGVSWAGPEPPGETIGPEQQCSGPPARSATPRQHRPDRQQRFVRPAAGPADSKLRSARQQHLAGTLGQQASLPRVARRKQLLMADSDSELELAMLDASGRLGIRTRDQEITSNRAPSARQQRSGAPSSTLWGCSGHQTTGSAE